MTGWRGRSSAAPTDQSGRPVGGHGDQAVPRVVGKQQRYYEMPAAVASVLCWLYIAASEGMVVGAKNAWFLLLGLSLGVYSLRMRLELCGTTLALAYLGPWRHEVDLQSLQSVTWKHTGAAASRGSIFVRARDGRKLRIPVGRLDGIGEWGVILLEAAARCHADVDPVARQLLEGAGAPRTRRRT